MVTKIERAASGAGMTTNCRRVEPLLVTMKDACKRLTCGETKAYQLINAGVLDRVKLGRATRITLASIHRAAGL